MSHPETDALLERLITDERALKRLYAYAARHFDGSERQQRVGLDAEHVVNEALLSIREAGKLHEHPNRAAYIYKVITNKARDADKKATGLERGDHHYGANAHGDDDLADAVAARVDRRGHNAAVADAVAKLSGRARDVAGAKLDNPTFNINEIADHLGVSRDTVRRAYTDMRADPALRTLAADDSLIPPQDLEQP